jgi:uncharacterized protein YaiI (UPF0178 family)
MSGPRILVDADACPVKDEIYKVAYRHDVPAVVVSNSHFRVPDHPLVSRHVVSDSFDAADDWIAGQASPGAVVVTADILLAERCIKAGAIVISPAASLSPPIRSARRSRLGRSWRTCAPAGTSWEGPRLFPRRTAPAFCRRSTRRWCG